MHLCDILEKGLFNSFFKKGGNFPKFFLLFFFRKIAKNACVPARTLSHVPAHARAGVYVSAYGEVGVGMCAGMHTLAGVHVCLWACMCMHTHTCLCVNL